MSMVRRRQFLIAAGGLLAAPFAHAQRPPKVHRIGWLSFGAKPAPHLIGALMEGLREQGYVEGQNLVIEIRAAKGEAALLPAAAKELAQSNVEVIVTSINPVTLAAMQATTSIPIVMAVGTEVVAQKIVASLARPGGNVTGVTWDAGPELAGKRVQLLKEAVPGISRMAILWDRQGEGIAGFGPAIDTAAAARGLSVRWVEFKDDLESAFEEIARERADALCAFGGSRLFARRAQIAQLAAKHRLPDAYYSAEFVDAGGLMSYAPNRAGLFRNAAKYVARILKGAKPADLPVEQPTKFEFVINLKTAKALGIAIPQSVMLRADRVIE